MLLTMNEDALFVVSNSKQDINTYENNIGFLSISSKKGNSLIDDMNRRVQKLKDELEETKTKR